MKIKQVIRGGKLHTYVEIDSLSQEEKRNLLFDAEESVSSHRFMALHYLWLLMLTGMLLFARCYYFFYPFSLIKSGPHPVWIDNFFSTRTEQDVTVILVLFTTFFIICELARVTDFTLEKYTVVMLLQLPIQILIYSSLIVGLAVIACVSWDYAYPAQWLLWCFLGGAFNERVSDGINAHINVRKLKAQESSTEVQKREKAPIETQSQKEKIENFLQQQKKFYRQRRTIIQGSRQKSMRLLQLCDTCQQNGLSEQCEHCKKIYQHEVQRVNSQLLRAKIEGTEATLTLTEWLAILKNFNWKCAYCQTGDYQVLEHYVPIKQGGGTTAENCMPACYKCNNLKSGRHPERSFPEKV